MKRGPHPPKKMIYERICKRCNESHKTTTKSSGAICPKCKKIRGNG